MKEWTFHTGERGLSLIISEWGQEDGTPTIILHGFLEQSMAWNPVAVHLKGRILAPDQRGHGRSDHIGQGGFYHFWDYVSDLDALVNHLNTPINLVGHSMGGSVAALYAGCRPENIRRLALIEGLGPPDNTDLAITRARRFLDFRLSPTQHSPLSSIDEATARMKQHLPQVSEETLKALATRMTMFTPKAHDPQASDLTWRWDSLHRAPSPTPFSASLFCAFLDHITAPTLLVLGDQSSFKIPDYKDRGNHIPHATEIVIPKAGHHIHHDQPEHLARCLNSHFK